MMLYHKLTCRSALLIKQILLFILLLVSGAGVTAQDTLRSDTSNQLPEVIVSYQAGKFTPVSFQNISGRELKQKSTGQEPSFLLAETPSMTVYSDAGSTQGYSYFRLRGIDQARINMTFDGVPMNEPEDQGAYFSNYPDIFNSLSRVQVQRGVGTTKNGVASYGGSLQLFSPNLADSAYSNIGFGYGSFNSLRLYGEYNSGIRNRRAIYVRASQVYSDGYKHNSSNNSQSVFVSGGLFYDRSTWKVNLMAGHQKNQLAWLGVPDSLIAADRKSNVNENERDEFLQVLAQVQNNWRPDKNSTLQTTIYYTYLDGNNDFNLNGFLGLPTTPELYNYAFRSNLAGIFSNYTLAKTNFSWTTGLHTNVYSRQHTGSELALGRLYRNKGYKNEFSAFTKANYTLNRLNLFADIQYRYTNFDYKGSAAFEQLNWQFLNPKAGLSYSIGSQSQLYYSVGRTGREPTRTDMSGGNDDLLTDSIGNTMLFIRDAEYVVDHELGWRHQSAAWNLGLNVYYMDFKNEIVLDGKFGPNGLALTNNVENSFRAGLELQAGFRINKYFRINNNSSFNYSRIREQKEKFQPILTPPVIINQELIYNSEPFFIGLSARYQGGAFIDFANTSKVDPYFMLNGRAQYNLRQFQFGIFLNNITNAEYFNNGYVEADGTRKYFVQAPFNMYASIKYTF